MITHCFYNESSSAWIAYVGDPRGDWTAAKVDGVWVHEVVGQEVTDEAVLEELEDAVRLEEQKALSALLVDRVRAEFGDRVFTPEQVIEAKLAIIGFLDDLLAGNTKPVR